jgi:hypothetical protein
MTPAPPSIPIASEPSVAPGRGFGYRLRAWFFTGLVIFGPVAVTVYIAWWLIDTVDNWVKPLVPARYWPDSYLPFHVPGFGVVIAVVGLTLLGFLAANIAGRTLVSVGEALLDRTPVVRGIYRARSSAGWGWSNFRSRVRGRSCSSPPIPPPPSPACCRPAR